MCYSKQTPARAGGAEAETGHALAFSTAAKAVIKDKEGEAAAELWHTAIEASRAADGAEKVATAVTGKADAAAWKQNFDDEFIMAWAMLLVDTFDAESDAQKKFWAGVKATDATNPLGSEFGTIYKALEGDALTKADKALKAMCLAGK